MVNDTRAPVRLDRLTYFLAVAEAGGFTAAARRLGTGKAQVSQQVARLEAELGGALFQRTTRRVALTEAGQAFLARCGGPMVALREALDGFGDAPGQLAGPLRITAPPDFGSEVVAPLVAAFSAAHPLLAIELVTTAEVLDLVARRIDLAFRVGALRDSSLRALRLSRFEHWIVAAAPGTSGSRARLPRRAEDLAGAPLVALSGLPSPLRWAIARPGARPRAIRFRPAILADSPQAVQALVRCGAGLGILPDFSVAADVRDGRLVRVLPELTLPGGGVHLVHPDVRPVPAKVRAFVDFVRARLRRTAR